jgi:MYXO-CTERM domain-containing protein
MTADGFELMTPIEAIAALNQRGFLSSVPPPVQTRLLLRKYLPPPVDFGLSEEEFWWFFDRFEQLYADMPTWDGPAFAAELDELVIVPGMHAVDMLEAWPYLTRLHTTISPHEMTVDPTFHPNADLPAVARIRQSDALVYDGAQWSRYDIPLEIDQDGETTASARVCIDEELNWPYSRLEMVGMPAALRIETIPQMGPPQVMVDNTEAIASAIAAQNLGTGCNRDGGHEGGESGTGGGDGTGGGVDDLKGSACACSNSPGEDRPLAWGVGLLGLVGLGLRGARRRAARD